MQNVPFEQAKQDFDKLCLKACQDHEPYIVNRADNNHVVVLSLEDFNACQEAADLLSPSANTRRLLHSLESARRGKLTERELEQAYLEANREVDSIWEMAIADGLADETW